MSKCKCGNRAAFSVAVTHMETGVTKTADYCYKCYPDFLKFEPTLEWSWKM